jgi:hypothetical protein
LSALKPEIHINNIKIQFVLHNKHSVSIRKTNWLMLFGEIITVYCENHMELIDAPCGENEEFFNVKSGGTYSYDCALKG